MKVKKLVMLTERRIAESEVLKDCLQYLNLLPGCRAYRINTGAFPSEYKGRKRFIRFGVPGMSDIIGIYKGRFLAVEVKRPGNKPTDIQKSFLEDVRRLGGIATWVDSLDGLIQFMSAQ